MKTWYYLELLTPEAMKLRASTKSKITKDDNGENIPYLEINDAMLLIIVINKIQESCVHLFLINRSVNY